MRRLLCCVAVAASMGFVMMGCGDPAVVDAGGDTRTPDASDSSVTPDVPEAGAPDVRDVVMDTGPTCGDGIGPCNPVTNANCGSGESCRLAGDGMGGNTTMCGPAGSGGWNAPCSGMMPCREGFACLTNDMGATFRCVRLCCEGDNARCRDTAAGGRVGATCSVRINGLSFMGCQEASSCDWRLQNCPMMTQNCVPTDERGTTACNPTGMGATGAMCGGSTGVQCQRGHLCAGPMGGVATCLRICDPMATMATDGGGMFQVCPSGMRCGPVNGFPADFGVCITM